MRASAPVRGRVAPILMVSAARAGRRDRVAAPKDNTAPISRVRGVGVMARHLATPICKNQSPAFLRFRPRVKEPRGSRLDSHSPPLVLSRRVIAFCSRGKHRNHLAAPITARKFREDG